MGKKSLYIIGGLLIGITLLMMVLELTTIPRNIFYVIIVGMGVGVFFIDRNMSKSIEWNEALDISEPVLKRIYGSNTPKIKRFYHHSDQKRFSNSGKLWEVIGEGNPANMIVLLDAKSGKVIGGDLDIKDASSPAQKTWEEPVKYITKTPRKLRRKTTTDIES